MLGIRATKEKAGRAGDWGAQAGTMSREDPFRVKGETYFPVPADPVMKQFWPASTILAAAVCPLLSDDASMAFAGSFASMVAAGAVTCDCTLDPFPYDCPYDN